MKSSIADRSECLRSFLGATYWSMSGGTAALARPDDERRQARTHIFVAATLYWRNGSTPVRIRNMSQNGALIEALDLPDVETPIIIKRGSLEASGSVAWKAEPKAGLAFANHVYVADWMGRAAPSHQERVDEIVALLKADRRPSNDLHPPSEKTIEEELASLQADLAALGSSLASDAILVATHPDIQILDIAVQRLGRVLVRMETKPGL